jgi:pyridinium-3,5-biscarboxylic acid mononucleotide sulfurtransferase
MPDTPSVEPPSLSSEQRAALLRLRACIRAYGSAITAFSAGIDSTLVAVIAQQELGENALAVTAVSPSLAPDELTDARNLAVQLNLRHRLVETDEVEDPLYAANPANRCYFCKTHLYTALEPLARETGARYILNGVNLDDRGDWRPGQKAADERPDLVRSPLLEASFDKATIRAVARALRIPSWDKPALACLSSRIPYGTPVTIDTLTRIADAEAALRALGLRQVRVRHHDSVARIETDAAGMTLLLNEETRARAVVAIKAAGYGYVALDLAGYRTGSLNAAIATAAGNG